MPRSPIFRSTKPTFPRISSPTSRSVSSRPFPFDKITAVSTTGFSKGARRQAKETGIELREVSSLDPSSFEWLSRFEGFSNCERRFNLQNLNFQLNPEWSAEMVDAVNAVVAAADVAKLRFRAPDGTELSPAQVFLSAAQQIPEIANAVLEVDKPRPVQFPARYAPDDCFHVLTELGPAPISELIFTGEISLHVSVIPMESTREYRSVDGGSVISQVASFQTIPVMHMKMALEMHKLSATGETHVLLRVVDDGRERIAKKCPVKRARKI